MPRQSAKGNSARSGLSLDLMKQRFSLLHERCEVKFSYRPIANRILRRTTCKQCLNRCVNLCQQTSR
jgi:hypothetical protein